MMRLRFRCKYCGHDFRSYLYTYEELEITKCPICKDPMKEENIVNEEKKDVFGYDRNKPERVKDPYGGTNY